MRSEPERKRLSDKCPTIARRWPGLVVPQTRTPGCESGARVETVYAHARGTKNSLLSALHPHHPLDLRALAADGLLVMFGVWSAGAGLSRASANMPLDFA